jgi:hypothetical protein
MNNEHDSCIAHGMPTSYQPYAPEQDLLLPQSLQEWLPAGHLACYINDTIDALDLMLVYLSNPGQQRSEIRGQPKTPGTL